MLFTRSFVVPVWMVVFVLVALFAPRAGVDAGPLLLPLVAVAIITTIAMTALRRRRRVRRPDLDLMPDRLDPQGWAWRPARRIPAMPFTRNSLASLWIIAFGLFALSGGATIAAPVLLLLVVAGLAALATTWSIGSRVRHVRAATFDRRALPAADASEVIRMDRDQG